MSDYMASADFVLIHENGPEKELVKLPEGSSVFPSKMHGELSRLSSRLDELEQKYQTIQKYLQSDDFEWQIFKRQLQRMYLRTDVR